MTSSQNLKTGDMVIVNAHQRVPADLLVLAATFLLFFFLKIKFWKSSEPNGSVFIRTDQLDGETDWKVR